MRVLVADKLPDAALDRLRAAELEVCFEASVSGDKLAEALRTSNPDVLVVRSTEVDARHVEAAPSLSLVVRAGAGVNTIDLDACSKRGIYVSNCPGKNAAAVAELTIGLMVALDRRIADNVADLRGARWNKGKYSKARGLKGRTLGILGLGQIGLEVARRAHGMEMRVVAWSRSLTGDNAPNYVEPLENPLSVARQADVLTVHLALKQETRGLVNAEILAALKPGSLFLNTSRAEVVDEVALQNALETRDLWAGLDVFAGEPEAKDGAFSHALARHPRVYGTHHIGASTDQAQQAVADETCRIIEVYARTGHAPNCVNLTRDTDADHVLVVRHFDRVGVLASVLDCLRESNINVQEMENIIFAGGTAASARIHCVGRPPEAVLQRLSTSDAILHVSLVPLERSR